MAGIISKVRIAAEQRILFLPHAVRQMSRFIPMVSAQEVKQVILEGNVIEDYPEDVRGHSCLILGYGIGNRAIHVVCAPKDEYLAVITAYLPDPGLWTQDFRKRIET
jgi:hypothetical protein